jgi:hypothetical protein
VELLGVDNLIIFGITLGDRTSAGEINEGWGRLTWGENAWGGTGDVILQGLQLNISEGTVDASPDAMLTGQQLNTSLGSVQAFWTSNSISNRFTIKYFTRNSRC